MPSNSAIDLSLVPAPNVIEVLSYEQIYAEMLARLLTFIPDFDDSDESDPAVRILQVAAYFRMLDRQKFNDDAKAVMVAYAVGSDLDNLGILFRVLRLDGEQDDAYRERIVLAPDGYSVAGPAGAYKYLARSADADVKDASVASPSPGEVVVTILSGTGTGIVGAPLIATVLAAMSGDTVRPLTDHVTVQSAAIVNYAITAAIYTYAGPDKDLIMAAATAKLNTYVAAMKRLGRDITQSGITGALHVEGVQRVVITLPAATVAISDVQAANCTGITLTWAGIAA